MSDANSIESALAGLVSRRREVQAEAHEKIVSLAADPERCVEVAARVEPLLEHRDPQVRGTAVIALATARGEAALPALEARVADPEPGPRCDVAQAAVVVGGAAEPILKRLLADPVLEVQFAAATGLAELGDNAGFPVLIAALERSGLRFQALSALQALGDARAAEPVRRLFKRIFISHFERMAAAGVLARLGDADARAFILDRIGRRRADDRGYAIELAGELRLAGAADVLARTLADRSDLFRGAAARALGLVGDARAREMLVRVLEDAKEDVEVRMDAAEGLMHIGTPEARAALEHVAERAEPELRGVVREALEAMTQG